MTRNRKLSQLGSFVGINTATNTVSFGSSTSPSLSVNNGLKDSNNGIGSTGYILTSIGAGVSWTTPYAAGIQGIQGTQGVQGRQGTTGTGNQGVQGPAGVSTGGSGSQGIQGSQGSTGIVGVQGVQGATGSSGIGSQGSQGTTGIVGVQGTIGAQGPAGVSTGGSGSQGIQGSQGSTGIVGVQGVQGATGSSGIGSQGSQGTTGIVGVQGVQGATGSSGIGSQGSQGTTGTVGVQGIQGTDGNQGTYGGSWTVSAGSSTYSFTAPANADYVMWMRGNIPNGICIWNATVSISNSNVPVIGNQYGWYYTAGNALVLTAIPSQIIGTSGSISTSSPAVSNSNTFSFGITNNSGTNQTVFYGYKTI
jgi:hypothetical protein